MYLGKRIRIAIVDNDRLTLGVMKMMIERILPQANVCWAVSDGLTAVSKSLNSRTRPDVLLVDMSLEGMSGCDVCRTIREETAQVDLVGMTAFSLDRYCVPALENGASCLVDKANVKGLGSVKPTLTYERGALIREEVQTFSLWPLLLNGYRYSKARGVHVQHQCSGCGS